MSEETQATPDAPVTEESGKPAEVDWKAQARKWEARAKENRDAARANEAAARELEEIKLAQLSELEKAQQAAEEAAARAAAAEMERDRMAVLAKYQIPEEYQFLVDSGDLEAKATAVRNMVLKEAEAGKPLAGASAPLPRSLSDVTVEDQIRELAASGDPKAVMRAKLMQLSSK